MLKSTPTLLNRLIFAAIGAYSLILFFLNAMDICVLVKEARLVMVSPLRSLLVLRYYNLKVELAVAFTSGVCRYINKQLF